MIAAFRTPRAKVDRANHHIASLATTVTSVWEARPREVRGVVSDPDNPDLKAEWFGERATIQLTIDRPDSVFTIAGDAVHNLRSALDTLACDLAQINNRSVDRVYFPFCSEQSEQNKAVFRCNMHRSRSDVDALLQRLETFPNATENLRTIHDLDVIDKHQSLIMCVGFTSEMPFPFARATFAPNFRLVFHQLGQKLAFLNGRDVVRTLEGLSQQVSGTVKAFASLYGL